MDELKEIYDLSENAEGIIFKKVDSKGLNAAVRQVKNVLRSLKNLILLKQTTFLLLALPGSPDN